MDELAKSVNSLKNSNGAVSERLNVLMKQQASTPKPSLIKSSRNIDVTLPNGAKMKFFQKALEKNRSAPRGANYKNQAAV